MTFSTTSQPRHQQRREHNNFIYLNFTHNKTTLCDFVTDILGYPRAEAIGMDFHSAAAGQRSSLKVVYSIRAWGWCKLRCTCMYTVYTVYTIGVQLYTTGCRTITIQRASRGRRYEGECRHLALLEGDLGYKTLSLITFPVVIPFAQLSLGTHSGVRWVQCRWATLNKVGIS